MFSTLLFPFNKMHFRLLPANFWNFLRLYMYYLSKHNIYTYEVTSATVVVIVNLYLRKQAGLIRL